MSSSRERQQAVKKLQCFWFGPKVEVKHFREKIERTFATVFLPNQVESSMREYGGINCDVLCPELYNSKKILLYVHGGSFVGGSASSYRSFCASLANATSCRVIVPEFRLPPSHPYPAAVEDVQSAFRAMYTEEQIARSLDSGSGALPEIVVAADTSGASIALALLLSLKDRFRQAVSHVVLFSPWLDISPDSKKLTAKKSADEVFTGEAVNRSAEMYTYQDNRTNPMVSALFASKTQLEGLPPVFIQCGEKELFLEDAEAFAAKLQEAGVSCELDVWDNMMPLFQLADEELSESHLAVEKVGHLVTERNVRGNESVTDIVLTLEQTENARASEAAGWMEQAAD